ncbi:MAG: sulfatase-like hydrolase/transferase [Alphaproteobacteria bacterium]|nr:sulfatase-like hydrolase/transferase [Alphaproteobacteria bacterium]
MRSPKRFAPTLAILLALAACGESDTAKSESPAAAAPVMSDVAPAPSAARPPNVILIVADDLGINDLSLNTELRAGDRPAPVATPNINRIALEGVRFDQAYSGHATCAPSRASLMTGRMPQRYGFEFNPGSAAFAKTLSGTVYDGIPGLYFPERAEGQDPPQAVGVPPEEVTLAELLKSSGYRTAMFGKWHLGMAPDMQPGAQGFDEWVGFLGGASLYALPEDPDIVNAKLPIDENLWQIFRYDALRNGEPMDSRQYQTDLWADEAVSFIRRNAGAPFFAYVAFNAPHNPLQAPRAIYDELSWIQDHEERVYAAMVVSLDRAIGRILDALEEEGLTEDTLVIFTSDHGGAEYTRLYTHNLPFRGFKGSFWEGGIRVPLFVRWPAGFEAGLVVKTPVRHLDLFPALGALADAVAEPAAPLDGTDIFSPLAGGTKPSAAVPMIWRAGDVFAIFDGRYKLMTANRPERVWLYDLQEDPTEKVNIAADEPQTVARLTEALATFDEDVGPPENMTLFEIPSRADPPPPDPSTEDLDELDFVYWPS